MDLTFRKSDGAIVFALGGNVVGVDGLKLREGFEQLVKRRGAGAFVLVDCAQTKIMDSSGLGALVWAHTQLVRQGSGRIGLMGLSESFERLLSRADLLPLFEVYPDEDAARKGLSA